MTDATSRALWVGLGLVAGAVLHADAGAQDTTRARRDTTRVRRDTTLRVPIPPRADTIVKRDSIAQRDSAVRARLARLAADSVKAPLARSELPELVDVTRPVMRWDRAALFATGALSLLDLLERIPGLTAFRAGWLASPLVGGYLGDVGRVRVFYDGMELDALDPRAGGVLDLGSIQLWTAEEVAVERGADEIRVHVRSWRAQRTTPYTRADVGTGDQETNLYRGFFGRRFQRGEAFQIAAQQVSTTPARLGNSSNHATAMARLGWAKRRWALDATMVRATPDRGIIVSSERLRAGSPVQDTIVPVAATETQAYVRAAYGDPDGGFWAQIIAGGQEYRFTGQPKADDGTPEEGELPADPDTTRYQAQYVVSAGVTWRGLRLSATERLRSLEGRRYHSPAVRAAFGSRILSASLLGELRGVDADPHGEAAVRLAPVNFLVLGGALAARAPALGGGEPVTTTARAEAAVRVFDLWLGGGIIRRAPTSVAPPPLFGRRYVSGAEGQTTAAFATIRGRLWGPLYADVAGIRWEDGGGFYRPQYQSRSEVYVSTSLPRRFPSGNFGLLASVLHEYRSHTLFPTAEDAERAGGYRVLSGLIEIRILQAVLTYQYRNMLVEDYVTVPYYAMPRQSQFYGVRWEFWN